MGDEEVRRSEGIGAAVDDEERAVDDVGDDGQTTAQGLWRV